MRDPLDDYEIDSGPSPPDDDVGRPSGSWTLILVSVVALLVVAAGTIFFLRRTNPAPPREVAEQPAQPAQKPSVRQPLGPAVQSVSLPALDLTDPLVRELLSALSSRPELATWLTTEGLIRNVVACVDNVANGENPARPHLRRLTPNGAFRVVRRGAGTFIDPASYARYDGLAATAASLDPAGLARVYSTLRPRLVDAYKDLGHPEGDIDGAVERAIARLVDTPVLEGDVPLVRRAVMYQFRDADAEGLSAAQKQLLRMGPKNVRTVQNQLRAIASALGIPPERLRGK